MAFHAWGKRFGNKLNRDYQKSGTDCITCHVQNNQVMTGVKAGPVAEQKYGDWIHASGPNFYGKRENNCLACHETVAHPQAPIKGSDKNSCLECHSQKDKDGKYTHYLYWYLTRDKADQPRSPRFGLFDFISLTLPKGDQKKSASFLWLLTKGAHGGNAVNEIVLKILVLNKKDEAVFEQDVHLNYRQKKIAEANTMAMKLFNETGKIFSKDGLTFGPGSSDSQLQIPLTDAPEGGKIKLSAIFKLRFWMENDWSSPIYEKEFSF